MRLRGDSQARHVETEVNTEGVDPDLRILGLLTEAAR